ncbi:hypothetical protein C8N35_11253 [Breoghania corrubedonensis]|uniref:Sulfotransferase family protein n=1 Tax=Breoghania corrubedonensis TaxID=665038 RepID=A0A2T5UW52_9HYPH|nr:hypothetical protein [Breoghania corrubedonensis]PTW55728.1 hypothetical protein C8N35_11253 [Breoghania corrubedonensis]
MNTQIIILGFHRSGTSLFTDYLNQAGLFVGSDLLGATPTNHRGHFEDRGIVNFHTSMLQRAGVNWLASAPYFPVYLPPDHKEVLRLLANRDAQNSLWGFKDPRTCLFWDLWDTHASNPVYVVPLRHYEFCVDSLQRRAFRDADTKQVGRQHNLRIANNPDLSASSWLLHMARVLECVSKSPERSFVVDMHQLNKESRPVREVNERFELDLEDIEFGRVFDQSHFKATMRHPPVISPPLRRQCEELWEELMARATPAASADKAATSRSYRPFVLKTDHAEYERLRLEVGLGGQRREKNAPVRPVGSGAMGDGEVAGLFAERMRAGRYGKFLKVLEPFLSRVFDWLTKR